MATSENASPEATETVPAKENNKNTEKNKRNALPIYTASEMLVWCAKIYSELGMGTYHSKDLIAEIHGVVYDSIKQKLSAAQSYGFLEIQHGVGYKLTNQFLKNHKPESPAEKREGMIEALRLNESYEKLIGDLNGHSIPTEQGLAARLIRNFDIKDYAANKVANVFITNLRENGLIDEQNSLNIGILKSKKADEKPFVADKTPTPSVVIPPKKDEDIPTGNSDTEYITIPVPLKMGRRAFIKIPEDYTSEECERIAKFVDALK